MEFPFPNLQSDIPVLFLYSTGENPLKGRGLNTEGETWGISEATCCSTSLSDKQTASICKHFTLWRGLQLSQFSLWIVLPKCSSDCLNGSFLSLPTLFLGFLLSPHVSPPLLKYLNLRHITYCNCLGAANQIPLLCK